VLRLEHGMPAHRRLLVVVRRVSGCETSSDEALAVRADSLQPLAGDVLPVRLREMEATPELRLLQPGERCVVVLHLTVSNSSQRVVRRLERAKGSEPNAANLR